MNPSTNDMRQLNSVLKGARAATETYKQALEKVKGDSAFATSERDRCADELRKIQSDHIDSVLLLKQHIEEQSTEPALASGTWGGVAKIVMGTAKLFGDRIALKALKEGEEHGLRQYQELADNPNVSEELKSMAHKMFIPRQKDHICKLDQIIDEMAS